MSNKRAHEIQQPKTHARKKLKTVVPTVDADATESEGEEENTKSDTSDTKSDPMPTLSVTASKDEIKAANAAAKKAKASLDAKRKKVIEALVRKTVTPYTPAKKYNAGDAKELAAAAKDAKLGNLVVFKNVLGDTDAEIKSSVDRLLSLLWDYLEAACVGVNRANATTWTNEVWPAILSVGIFKYDGIGQSAFLWAVRSLPRVRAIFEAIYGTESLYVSFDGCGVFRGPQHDTTWNHSWLHFDQNLKTRPLSDSKQNASSVGDPLLSFQGALNLIGIGADGSKSGSFLFLPGSAAEYKERAAAGLEDAFLTTKGKNQYCALPFDHHVYQQITEKKQEVCVLSNLDAGDFYVWPSILCHANLPPADITKAELKSKSETDLINEPLRRAVAYLTFQPFAASASIPTEKSLRLWREKGAANGITTSHWPCEPYDNEPAYPRVASFEPITMPRECMKTTFTAAELAGLLGVSLRVAEGWVAERAPLEQKIVEAKLQAALAKENLKLGRAHTTLDEYKQLVDTVSEFAKVVTTAEADLKWLCLKQASA